MGKVRICGGQYARRAIHFLDRSDIRPTSVRSRKVLFDWIRFKLQGKRCLDLFSGSGILGFEALSQGADSVLSIDNNSETCQSIMNEASRIGEGSLLVKCATIPFQLDQKFDICFMDPPFSEKETYVKTLSWLKDLLISGGLLYLEADHKIENLDSFELYKYKRIASVSIHLFIRLPY